MLLCLFDGDALCPLIRGGPNSFLKVRMLLLTDFGPVRYYLWEYRPTFAEEGL